MSSDDVRIEHQFQAELAALEAFRVGYAGAHPNVPLSGADPDVQRMIEALAFFTARTRLASERSVDESLSRIFRQHFPYLLSPVPALTMLTVTPQRGLAEPVDLPEGTAIELASVQQPGRVFFFQTLKPLKLLPIVLESARVRTPDARLRDQTVGAPQKRPRVLELHFVSPFPRSSQFESVGLQIDYLGDLSASLLVYSELRRHVRSASVAWQTVDTRFAAQRAREVPCTLSFRKPLDLSGGGGAFAHPVQGIRAALHCPQQALSIAIESLSPPANWQAFTVSLELGDAWPDALHLHRDVFRLHTVAIANIQRELSETVEHDGTRARHRLRHPQESEHGFVPVVIHGAYRMSDAGFVPLVPSVLTPRGDNFEAHTERTGAERRGYLALSLEGAFEAPANVVAEASWHQPDVALLSATELTPRVSARAIEASLRLDHELVAPLETDACEDREALLELLSIKGHRILQLDALRLLLRAMGVSRSVLLRSAYDALRTVDVHEKPSGKRGRVLKYVYEVEFGYLTASDVPKAEFLVEQMFDLLRVWSGRQIIELRASIPNLGHMLQLTATESDRT
jgi:type VI secretion system protein ImpG